MRVFILAKINSVHPAQLTPMPSKPTEIGSQAILLPKAQRSAECLLCKRKGLGAWVRIPRSHIKSRCGCTFL